MKHQFEYTVDGEPQSTDSKELTADTILKNAGLDPTKNYLVELLGDKEESFKDKPNAEIHMHEHLRFISVALGGTPVS